jgi:hypothetical protein
MPVFYSKQIEVFYVYTILEGLSSSDNDVDHYIIIGSLLESVSRHDGNQNCQTGDLIEHAGDITLKVAYPSLSHLRTCFRQSLLVLSWDMVPFFISVTIYSV